MKLSKKQAYISLCKNFIADISKNNEYQTINEGVFYKILSKGGSNKYPSEQSVITVHYMGKLITGKVFDNSKEKGVPEAFRLSEVIDGWKIALKMMCIGDIWEVIIAPEYGYGKRSNGNIPGGSVLIFQIELLNIC